MMQKDLRQKVVPSTTSKGTDEPLILSSRWEDLKSREGDTTDELLTIVRVRNYVPSSAEEEYRTALLREYAAFQAPGETRD
jgi:hypothetical protein